jgi:hypothetical protein
VYACFSRVQVLERELTLNFSWAGSIVQVLYAALSGFSILATRVRVIVGTSDNFTKTRPKMQLVQQIYTSWRL